MIWGKKHQQPKNHYRDPILLILLENLKSQVELHYLFQHLEMNRDKNLNDADPTGSATLDSTKLRIPIQTKYRRYRTVGTGTALTDEVGTVQ